MTAKRLSERIQMRAEFAGVVSNIVVIKDIHRQHFFFLFSFPNKNSKLSFPREEVALSARKKMFPGE